MFSANSAVKRLNRRDGKGLRAEIAESGQTNFKIALDARRVYSSVETPRFRFENLSQFSKRPDNSICACGMERRRIECCNHADGYASGSFGSDYSVGRVFDDPAMVGLQIQISQCYLEDFRIWFRPMQSLTVDHHIERVSEAQQL